MLIKSVALEDVPALSLLATETFTETFGHLYPPEDLNAFLEKSYSPESLAPHVANSQHFWRMIWEGDEAIAYLHCKPVSLPHPEARPEHDGEISRLYVHSKGQGKGFGRRLMQEAFGWLEDTYGTAPQWLGVWCNNLKAQALYSSYSFTKVGEYKFPVGNTLDDEFIFRRQP